MRAASLFQSTPDEVARVLQDAKRLICTPDRWCAGHLFRGETFCMEGALRVAGAGNPAALSDAMRVLRKLLGIPRDRIRALFDWNDAPDRTHAEVITALEEAADLAEWIMQPREVAA